ncbi:unnamed protein product [Meloidogyne enterolobii]|uniref:Uncharacterized protein n=1 Tax=Meloidogyne enterolobii TaxID=390850 RepID=A0ACB0YG07_MELEN
MDHQLYKFVLILAIALFPLFGIIFSLSIFIPNFSQHSLTNFSSSMAFPLILSSNPVAWIF